MQTFGALQDSCELAKARRKKEGDEGSMGSCLQKTTILSFLETFDEFKANITTIQSRISSSPKVGDSPRVLLSNMVPKGNLK